MRGRGTPYRKTRLRRSSCVSLWYFLKVELKLSAGAAQNRKAAVELIQRFPEVEAALRSGELCLTTINELGKVLTAENLREVLPRSLRQAQDRSSGSREAKPSSSPRRSSRRR